jgi:hypothetical protein
MTAQAERVSNFKDKANLLLDQTFPRMKPSAICIGAQKGGTSALYKYLACHPGVAPSRVKEIDFFNCNARFGRGLKFYHSHFPRRTLLNRRKLTFDITPGYLFGAEIAAQRIYDYNPQLRIMALLRDPVTRAHSAWQMYRRYCKDNFDWFFNWVRRCDEGLSPESFVRRPRSFGADFEKDILDEIAAIKEGRTIQMPILMLGEYYKLLKPYLDRFPHGKTLVISSEQMQKDTTGNLKRIEEFVGLKPHRWTAKQVAPRFVGGYEKAIPPKAKALLQSFYCQQNGDLFSALQTDFGWQ